LQSEGRESLAVRLPLSQPSAEESGTIESDLANSRLPVAVVHYELREHLRTCSNRFTLKRNAQGDTNMLPGPSELILILLIVVMVFGAKRIPEIMNGIGQGIRSFKKAVDEEEPPAIPPTPPPGPQTEVPKEKVDPK
jgi:sec-independent protein translocase protein TatA